MSRRSSRSARELAALVSPAGLGFYDRGERFEFPPHLQVIDRVLCDVAAGRLKRVIIEMPPRHGKSMEVSEYFTAWYQMRYPDRRIILASYADSLAASFGRKARDLVKRYGPDLFGVQVNPAVSAAHEWQILDHPDGGMVTAGVGGGITGKGADILIIDDPVKNQDEAQSETMREKVWDWYTSTAYTRLEPDGAVIIIQTRWHEDDLAGRAQRQEDEGWTVISMPAVCDDEENDPLGRKHGEALWPRRYSAQRLASVAKAVGSFVWNALYQQRPVAAEGNILKKAWWKEYEQTPREMAAECDIVIQTWDLTFKDSEGADRVAGLVLGAKYLADESDDEDHDEDHPGVDVYVLDCRVNVLNFPASKEAIRGVSKDWPQATAKLVEDKANGPALIADLKGTLDGLIAVEPQGGKTARVIAASPLVESGNVYLPMLAHAPWVADFIAECAAFPTGRFDDQPDAFAQGVNWLKQSKLPSAAQNPLNQAVGGRRVRDEQGRRIRK